MNILDEAGRGRLPCAVVSVGMFDGVHRGHTKVLRLLRERGLRLGVPTVVVTFDPHPRAVVRPDACPKLLSTLDDRMALLASTGAVDHCLVLRFDQARSRQGADEFALVTLVARLGMQELIVGENFACGKGRRGTVEHLAGLGREAGFCVIPVRLDAVQGSDGSVRSSSTEARRLIQLGDLTGASAVLERPYELSGTITGASAQSLRVMDAELCSSMCVPAEADYIGSVRRDHRSAVWVPALLRVRRSSVGGRSVRTFSHDAVHARPGDQIRLRFIDRARVPIHPST